MIEKKWILLLAAAALMLALLAGCGNQNTPPAFGGAPTAVDKAATEPAEGNADGMKEEDPEAPADIQPKPEPEPAPEPAPEPVPEPAPAPEPEPTQEADSEPVPELEPAPEPVPAPDLEPAEAVPEDGIYTANVALEGGTGRASIESPAALRCEDGVFWAAIVWSSPNFDYMKVDGVKYEQTNVEGNSTFEIPVAAFDQKLNVIANTIAMSEPHEVEYTVQFDSASLQKQ